MNKKMILPFVAILVLAVAMVGAASADEVTTVDKVEVRGEVVRIDDATSPELVWNATNFAGFWYDLDDDLMTETLWINASVLKATTTGAGEDRTIEEDKLWYTTSPEFQEYELHENEADPDRDNKTAMEIEYGVNKGLCVESDRDGGDCGYFIEGFMAKKYIAIDANADKLCELLVEFEDDDKKTLATGEEWDLGSGFSLAANQIDLEGDKVWFTLNKDGKELDSEVISTDSTRADRVYTYTADIGNEEEIPVFSCYVDAVFRGTDSNIVQVMYVFLIDDDVMEIDTSDTYGIMEVMTASKNRVTLRNNEDTLDLDTDTTEKIMGDMYFKTADNAPTDNQIRFYPFVEYTEPGTYEVRGGVVRIDDATSPELVWNATNFAGFWYDLDDDLMTETLWINASVLKATTTGAGEDRTIEEDKLWYTTSPEFQEYELHENEADPDRDNKTAMEIEYGVNKGLCVESDRDGGDCGYFIEGFMAKKYIAIDANADKLCELLVEFEDDDKKTLATGEEWDLGSGFSLAANQIDLEGDKVWFTLNKDGKELDSEVISTDSTRADRVYTYTADIGNEEEIPVFSCYVDAVFRGTDSNIVQVMYVFLIDDDVMEIDTSDTYGIMEVMTASKNRVTLRNNEDTLDLDTDTTEKIMGGMYFKTADNAPTDNQIRFYPFVEYTIGEGGVVVDDEEVETPTDANETVEANVTATAEVTPTPELTATVEETVTDAEDTTTDAEPAATEKKTPGFEAIFAIAGLLAVAYLVLRQRE